jgi:hypothetical protein
VGVPAQEMMHINESGRTELLKVFSVNRDISTITPAPVQPIKERLSYKSL